MIRATLLIAAALSATPLLAQAGTYRERLVTVYGTDACPKASNPDEIVVCTRRPEEERFRIPRPVRETDTSIDRRDNVGEQRAALASGKPSATGIGSCSSVGPGGMIGCNQGLNVVAAVRRAKEGIERAIEPVDK
ncbi:hypothetical protein [Sandaracinobacteroides saxicola]|uniref:Uncharacterized protein n=1 Tax=Sandaracinobacteroides saxicola TaxID=2759707 RepID=A0A7G5IJA3_9SPHN|nr:hypothetical protein [Sandaracinobacteroides saxicola]QMW23445.1 hypothetical protein H3309_02775 [Sandaracinobacteroides saxicola]